MWQSATKTSYRVDFVGHGDNIIDVLVFEENHDKAAIVHAHRIDLPSIGDGFDVWQGTRLVHKHRR